MFKYTIKFLTILIGFYSACPAYSNDIHDNLGQTPSENADSVALLPENSQLPQWLTAQITLPIYLTTPTQLRHIYSRLYAVREGSRCIDARHIDLQEQIKPSYLFFTPSEHCLGKVDVSDLTRIESFLNSYLSSGQLNTTETIAGFEFETHGLTMGIDYRLTDWFVMGSAFNYNQTDAVFKQDNGNTNMDVYSFSVYSLVYETDKFYIDTIYSYATQDYDTHYLSSADWLPNTLFSRTNGAQQMLSLSLGHHFHQQQFTFTPAVRFDYLETTINDFKELLPASAQLSVDEQNQKMLTVQVGSDISYTRLVGWGLLVPQVRLHAIHDAEYSQHGLKGQINEKSLPTVRLDFFDKTHFTFGLSVLAQFSRDKIAYVDYETVLGLDNMTQHTVAAGVRFAF